MARSCFLFTLFAATLLLQGSRASISDIVDQIQGDIQSTIEKAQSAVSELEEHVKTLAEEETERIEDDVKNITSTIKDDVESEVKKVEAEVGQVEKCSAAIPSEVEEVGKNITESAIKCVTTPVDEAKAIVEDLVSQAESLNSTARSLLTDIDDCKTKVLTAAICYGEVIYKAVSTLSTLSAKVTSDITKGAWLVTSFKSVVTSCESEVIAALPNEKNTLIKTITSCYTANVSS